MFSWITERIIQRVVRSLADLKTYIHLSQLEGIKIPKIRLTEEIAVEEKQVPHHRDNFVMNSIEKKNIPFEMEVRLNIEVEEEHISSRKIMFDIDKEDQKSYGSDESVRTFDMISDIGIEQIRTSKAINNIESNPKFLHAKMSDAEFEETGREETKDATADQGSSPSAFFKNGEWLKWVPER
jgi:hypothetical protein